MTKQELHDLAVAFAAVKLKEYQLEQRAKNNQPFLPHLAMMKSDTTPRCTNPSLKDLKMNIMI